MNNLSAFHTFIMTPVLGMLNFHACLAWECSEIRWRGKRRAEGKENETLCLLLCRGINYTSSSQEAVFNFFLSSFHGSLQYPSQFPDGSPRSSSLGVNLSIPFSACPFPLHFLCFIFSLNIVEFVNCIYGMQS